MIYDDKTTEIILSESNATQASSAAKPITSVEAPRKSPDLSKPVQGTPTLIAKTPWWLGLQEDLQDDWTLRVLAALTILVLSLLVL